MTDDEELRELFRQEAAEHVQALEIRLLRLEQEPACPNLLDQAFREAHAFKGSAQMVGARAVEGLARRFEEILNQARRGQGLESAQVARLHRGLEGLRELVDLAIQGGSSQTRLSTWLAEVEPQ